MHEEMYEQIDLLVEVVLLFASLVAVVIIFTNVINTSEKFSNVSIAKANIKSEYDLKLNQIENGTRVKFAQFQEGFVLKEGTNPIKAETDRRYLIKDIKDGEVQVEVIR